MKLKSFYSIALMICFTIICAITAYGQTNAQEKDSLKTVIIKVGGITCGNDLKIINSNVMKLNGVVSCIDITKAGPSTSFEVKYNPAIVPIDSIYKAVENSPSCDFPDQKPYKVKKSKKQY